MAWYVSDTDGIGGRLRETPAAFRVEELEQFAVQPVDADPGAYPHLVVRATLHDWDTNGFAMALAEAAGISRERVSWAGTKDKRAVTTQLFSVTGLAPGDLPAVSDADLEIVGRAGRPILFGDLAGNAFEVTVADPDHPEHVDDICAELAAFGRGGGDADDQQVAVPNYFGHQRFGSRRAITHEVGLAVIREDWETAVMTYLGSETDREPRTTREGRHHVRETRDWQASLETFPESLRYERAMLHSLVETGGTTPDEFQAALGQLPSNLQTLLVNAAQSYVFNRIVSERMDQGLPFDEAVAGDVVCFADREAPSGFALPDPSRTQRVTADRVDTVNRHCQRGRAFVTAPLVGTDTTLADGTPGEIERGVLADLDLAPDDFDLRDPYGSSGTRRAILVRTALQLQRDPLTFAFRLPKGCYATVLLREFLKVDPGRL